jgi:peptide/nickel transport system permease protein
MSMGRFLLRRILHSVYVLLGLSIVIFIIARLMPGDPARMAVGARAPQFVVDRIREQMHLNEPIYVQYAYWLRDAVQGDFGLSLVTQRPVVTDVKEFLPASLELVFIAGIMAAVSAWALFLRATKIPG